MFKTEKPAHAADKIARSNLCCNIVEVDSVELGNEEHLEAISSRNLPDIVSSVASGIVAGKDTLNDIINDVSDLFGGTAPLSKFSYPQGSMTAASVINLSQDNDTFLNMLAASYKGTDRSGSSVLDKRRINIIDNRDRTTVVEFKDSEFDYWHFIMNLKQAAAGANGVYFSGQCSVISRSSSSNTEGNGTTGETTGAGRSLFNWRNTADGGTSSTSLAGRAMGRSNGMLNASCVIKDFTVSFSEKKESFMFPLDDLRGITISNDYEAVRKYVLFIEFISAMSPLSTFSPPVSPSRDSQKYALSPSFTTALRLRVGVKDVEIGEAAVGGAVTLPLTSAEVKTGATSAGAASLAITHTKPVNNISVTQESTQGVSTASTTTTSNTSGFMSYAYRSTFQHRSTGPHEEPNHTAAAGANTSILAEQFIPFGEFIGGSMTVDELEQHAGDAGNTYNSPVHRKAKGGAAAKAVNTNKIHLNSVKTMDIPLRPQQRGQALRLMVRGACDLLTLSKDKTPPSAYCIVYLLNANGEKLTANTVERRTSIVNKDCNPTWECEILLQKEETEDEMGEALDAGAAAVFVKVRDASSGHLKHAHLGQVSIPLGCFIDQVAADLTLPLEPTYRMLQNTQDQLGEIMVTTELVSIRDSIKAYRNSFERKRSNSFGGGSPRKFSVDHRGDEEPKLQAVTVNYCLRISSPYDGWWPARILINDDSVDTPSHFPLHHYNATAPSVPHVWYELSLGYSELVIRLHRQAPTHESTSAMNSTHTGQLKSAVALKLKECMESSDHPAVAAAFAHASYEASSSSNAADKLAPLVTSLHQDSPIVVHIPWTQVMTCAAATDAVALLHITVHTLSTNGPSPTSGHTHTPTSPDEHQVSYVPVAIDLLVAPCPADKLTKAVQERRNLYMVRQELVRWFSVTTQASGATGGLDTQGCTEDISTPDSPVGVNDMLSPNITTAEEEVRLLSLVRPIAAALESLTSSAPFTKGRPLSTATLGGIDNTPPGIIRYTPGDVGSPFGTSALALPLSPISVDYDCNSMSTAGRHSTALIARAKVYFSILRYSCRYVCVNHPQPNAVSINGALTTMLLQHQGRNEQLMALNNPASIDTFTVIPFEPNMACAFDVDNIQLLIHHDLNDFSDMAPDAANVLKNAVSLATDNAPSTPTSKHKPTPAELIAKNAKNKSAVDAIIAAANASGTFNQSMSLLDSSTIVLHIEHIIDRAAGRIRDFIICSSPLWCPATGARNVSTLLTPGYRCLEQLITGYHAGVVNILNIFLQSKESLLNAPGEELRNGLMKFVLHKNMCFHDAIKGLIRPLGLAFQPTLSLYNETHLEQLINWYGIHMIQSIKSWLVKTIQNAWTEKDKSHSLPWDVVLVANKYISTLPEVFRRQLNIFLEMCSGVGCKELTIDDVAAVGHELHEVLTSDSFESGGGIDNTAEEWKYLLLINEKIISAAVRSLVLLADEYERALQSKRWAVGSDIEVADNMTFLVSVVNDTCRMKTIHVYPLLHIPVQSLSTVNHVRMVIDAYSAVHKLAVSHIVKLMFADLKSILVDFLNIWSPGRNTGTGKTDIVGTIVATLADYARDLRKGLEQNSYIQIILQCADTCAVRYLLFIKEKADTNVKFTEGELERVLEDLRRLVSFFEGLIDEVISDGWMGADAAPAAEEKSNSPLHCFLISECLQYLMDVRDLLSLPHDDCTFTQLLRKLGKRYATNELRIVVANLLTSCVITLRPDSDLELIQAVASLLGTGSDVVSRDARPPGNPYPFIDVTLKQIDYAALSTETVMSASTVVRPNDLFVRIFRDEEDIKNNIAFEDTKSSVSKEGIATPMKGITEKHGFSKHKNMASSAMKNFRGISIRNVKENLKSFTPQASARKNRRPSETFDDDDVRSTGSSVRGSDAGSVGQQSAFSARLKLFSSIGIDQPGSQSAMVEKSMVIEISSISLRGLIVSASHGDDDHTGKRKSIRSSMRFLAGGSSGAGKSADPIPLKCNPYCAITLVPTSPGSSLDDAMQRLKTSVQWDVTEAHWRNMSLRFTITSSNIPNVEDFDVEDSLANSHAVHVEVYDKNRISRKVFLGAITVKLSGIDVHPIESWFALSSKNDSSTAEFGHLPQQASAGDADHQGELFVKIQKVESV